MLDGNDKSNDGQSNHGRNGPLKKNIVVRKGSSRIAGTYKPPPVPPLGRAPNFASPKNEGRVTSHRN
jgi:hypothetical protein